MHVRIIGRVKDPAFHKARLAAEVSRYHTHLTRQQFQGHGFAYEIVAMFPFDFDMYLKENHIVSNQELN